MVKKWIKNKLRNWLEYDNTSVAHEIVHVNAPVIKLRSEHTYSKRDIQRLPYWEQIRFKDELYRQMLVEMMEKAFNDNLIQFIEVDSINDMMNMKSKIMCEIGIVKTPKE